MVLVKDGQVMKTPYRQVFDESSKGYDSKDIHAIALKLEATSASICNADSIALYNLRNDVSYYCDTVGTDKMPNVSDHWDDYNKINNKFANIMATAGLYTSQNDAKYMTRATELGAGEIIYRNSMEYESRFHKICVSDNINAKQELSDALNSQINRTIDKVLSNYPNQKDEYIDAVNSHENYLMDLNNREVMDSVRREYLMNINPEEVRDRIIAEENMDVTEAFDNLPWYVTERLKNEAGIYDNKSYEEPWNLKFDEESGELLHVDDIEAKAITTEGPNGELIPGYEPGYGDLGGMETGPVIGGEIPGSKSETDKEDKIEEIYGQRVAVASGSMPPPDPNPNGGHEKVIMPDDRKIYSVELKWRDNHMPAGAYTEDERAEECHSVSELLRMHHMIGPAAERDGVKFEILKVRSFDTWNEYYAARDEGFKTYDAMVAQADKSDALPEIFDENGIVKPEVELKISGSVTQRYLDSKQNMTGEASVTKSDALPEIFDENGIVKPEIVEKYESKSLKERLKDKLESSADTLDDDDRADRIREEEMLDKWDKEHDGSW